MIITAPGVAGSFLLELDMVQDDGTWFKQRGSETAIVPVEVHARQSLHDVPATVKARMEMYGVPLETVVSIVTSSGGHFVEIKQEPYARGWRSYRYCVTKNGHVSDEPPSRYAYCELELPARR
jgi:hypothetical protein